jgi:hypothetical protein
LGGFSEGFSTPEVIEVRAGKVGRPRGPQAFFDVGLFLQPRRQIVPLSPRLRLRGFAAGGTAKHFGVSDVLAVGQIAG